MNEINYQGKCDKCGRTSLELTVPILKANGDNTQSMQLWCIDCLRAELHKNM